MENIENPKGRYQKKSVGFLSVTTLIELLKPYVLKKAFEIAKKYGLNIWLLEEAIKKLKGNN